MPIPLIRRPPWEYTDEEIVEAVSRAPSQPYPRCFLCGYMIGCDEEGEEHHPGRKRFPDWTVPVHADCHRAYHSRNGDYRRWGGRSSTSGRLGYELALARWPNFHRMGGLVRAHSAERNAHGQFISSTNKGDR